MRDIERRQLSIFINEEELKAWLTSHIPALEELAGLPQILEIRSLTTSVVKKSQSVQPSLNHP